MKCSLNVFVVSHILKFAEYMHGRVRGEVTMARIASIWSSTTWTLSWGDRVCEHFAIRIRLTRRRSHFMHAAFKRQMSHASLANHNRYQQNNNRPDTLTTRCESPFKDAPNHDDGRFLLRKFTCAHSSEMSNIYGCHFVNYFMVWKICLSRTWLTNGRFYGDQSHIFNRCKLWFR